ncbi:hypothetical protein HMPREF1556_00878, partial [Porphyromonas sp. oral taxon 278 str. W7784]
GSHRRPTVGFLGGLWSTPSPAQGEGPPNALGIRLSLLPQSPASIQASFPFLPT